MKMKIRSLIPVLLAALVAFSCKSAVSRMGTNETPTRGNITIGVDESYYPLSEAEVNTFEAIYKDAEIEQIYASEDSVLSLFMDDSIRLMITSRPMTENEVAYLRSNLIVVRTTKIAYDALALV